MVDNCRTPVSTAIKLDMKVGQPLLVLRSKVVVLYIVHMTNSVTHC